jgi:hypothetical protein
VWTPVDVRQPKHTLSFLPVPKIDVFYFNQDASWQPAALEFSRDECRNLKAKGLGRFINNGKAFRLHQSAPLTNPRLNLQPQPDAKDRGSDGRGNESCHPQEPLPFHGVGVMTRFADGDPFAWAIIEAWKFRFPVCNA